MKKQKPLEVMILGAGNRGIYTYGELCKREDINMKVVAVAEPILERREKMKIEHNLSDYSCFETAEQAFKIPKFCDAVINSTPDRSHHKLSLLALNKGYNLLLEKPMASTPKDCVDILKAQEKTKKVLSVAHVLRYSPFFQKLSDLLSTTKLGKVLSFDLLEEVGYWHYAHSYVRGNWRRKNESGPIILTKCCHDLDIISCFIDDEVKSIFSRGSLKYFRNSNAPKGSTKRCIDDCKVKKICPYNAEKFYLSAKSPEDVRGAVNVISPVDKSLRARKEALKKGPYGRCVYKCDNNVCDNQEVLIRFKNGLTGRFTLISQGSEPTRKIKIYLERGEIQGDLSKGSIRLIKYSGLRGSDTIDSLEVSKRGGHGGGDEYLLKNFVKTINENNPKFNLTTIQKSLDSHLIAFAAEESRLKGRSVNFQTYKRKLGLK
jgi:predicted dehydrogenase